jgi:recombinational DNA repair ATPase RecF
MRIIELELREFRGAHHLKLRPNGRNLVVVGPNGVGKSTIIDALDFLLTGNVGRLSGTGSAGVTLAKHGPHMDANISDSFVRASVLFEPAAGPIELRRDLASPGVLIRPPGRDGELAPVLAACALGQHLLTRRELLKFVAARAAERGERVQALLNADSVETVRQTIVKSANAVKRQLRETQTTSTQANGEVASILGIPKFESRAVSNRVNILREILGAQPLDLLSSSTLKNGISPLAGAGNPDPAVDPSLPSRIDQLLERCEASGSSELADLDAGLRTRLLTFKADPQVARHVAIRSLVVLGLEQIPETGECPLCEATWEPGKLREHLNHRLEAFEATNLLAEEVRSLASRVRDMLASAIPILSAASLASERLGMPGEAGLIKNWKQRADVAMASLERPLDNQYLSVTASEDIARLFLTPESRTAILACQAGVRAKTAIVSPTQEAWETLTKLEVALGASERALHRVALLKAAHANATILLEEFVHSRDEILATMYSEVSARFVELYRQLHPEESNFTAAMELDNAGVDLRVDFRGRGEQPPLAVHSEGHQDSMGLCLFLALSERISGGNLGFSLLDDVIMSVDGDHRRLVSKLLATLGESRQLVITTHDPTWARQLRSDGVATKDDLVPIVSWSIEGGPVCLGEKDSWALISADLEAGDIPAAAARLRRWLEETFYQVCVDLDAKVTLRDDGRWELGELLSSACTRYRELVKQGKVVANGRSERGAMAALQAIDSKFSTDFQATQAEQWGINPMVHYTAWASLGLADFAPIVAACRALVDDFYCADCSGLLRTLTDGKGSFLVRCPCGHVSWDLRS